MNKKKVIYGIIIVIGLIIAYYTIYVPNRKKKLATEVWMKYTTATSPGYLETFETKYTYESLRKLSLKCLKGLLNDANYKCS